MIDYTNYQLSLQHLAAQYKNYQTLHTNASITPLIREAVAESVIQRYEICFDTVWKSLKRYLEDTIGLQNVPASPKGVIRKAWENNVLPSQEKTWFNYADARNATAHDYSSIKAEGALNIIPDFIADAKLLYTTITQDPWA